MGKKFSVATAKKSTARPLKSRRFFKNFRFQAGKFLSSSKKFSIRDASLIRLKISIRDAIWLRFTNVLNSMITRIDKGSSMLLQKNFYRFNRGQHRLKNFCRTAQRAPAATRAGRAAAAATPPRARARDRVRGARKFLRARRQAVRCVSYFSARAARRCGAITYTPRAFVYVVARLLALYVYDSLAIQLLYLPATTIFSSICFFDFFAMR